MNSLESGKETDMSRSTISTFKLFELFPNEDAARTYLQNLLWSTGVRCPECNLKGHIAPRKGKEGFYLCNRCRKDFSVRTGTIFGRSHVPLHKWIYSMYLLLTARKGISSLQLAKEIGVTQKSAWFVLQRIREACGGKVEILKGIVEIDETYIGGKEQNRHMHARVQGRKEKVAVMGMRERGGNVIAKVLPSTSGSAIQSTVRNYVAPETRLMGDENPRYKALTTQSYKLDTVTHTKEEYVRGDVHTNSIESVWAVMKRGLHGVYHHASRKHLGRYVDEFTFRLSEGNVGRHTLERLASLVVLVSGKRITYERLIA